MSFQASLSHKSSLVSYTPQLPPHFYNKLLPRGHQRGNWHRRHRMDDVSNFINICPANPIKVLNIHRFLLWFCLYPSTNNFDKKWCWYWGPTAQAGSIVGINIGDPKVIRTCQPYTANRTSADCVEITPVPSVQHIPPGVYHIGVSTLCPGSSRACISWSLSDSYSKCM